MDTNCSTTFVAVMVCALLLLSYGGIISGEGTGGTGTRGTGTVGTGSACPDRCDCQHARHLSCANRGLRAVPRAAPGVPTGEHEGEEGERGGLLVVSLGGNFIVNVSASDFAGYGDLVRLNLQFNRIQSVHPRAFDALAELEELYLGHNLLATVPPETLRPLKKLTVLYANHNGIETLTAELFADLRSLVKLRLDGNAIGMLQDSVFASLVNLHYLHLEHNRLRHIHAHAFSQLAKLRFLNLAHNKQSSLRDVVLFSRLRALSTLLLSDNDIRHVGNSVFQHLERLSKLSLSNNRISRLDGGALRGLTGLRELLMDGNELEEIPAGLLDPLARVEELDFSGNRISRVDAPAFSRLRHLRVLRLRDNRLSSLSGDVFALNGVLYDLDLHGNNWTCDCRLEELKRWMATAHSRGKLLTVFIQCGQPATLKGKYLDYVNSSQLLSLGNRTHACEDRAGPEESRGGEVLEREVGEGHGNQGEAGGWQGGGYRDDHRPVALTDTPASFDLLRAGQEDEPLPLIADPCVFNRHFITNVSVDQITSSTVRVHWTARAHHRYSAYGDGGGGGRGGGGGGGGAEVHYRVLYDRFGTPDRFPRYVYAPGAARSVTLRELSADVTYMACVEGVVGGAPGGAAAAGRDRGGGGGGGWGLGADLHLITVATLVGNGVLLLVFGGVWLGRSLRRRAQRRKSAVHVRHMYTSRRPFRHDMGNNAASSSSAAGAASSADFTGYQCSRPPRLGPLEEGDLIEFPCDRFLDNSTARRDSDMQRLDAREQY
ncbi:unnamed protein product [Merluccius merluccius]